MKGQGGKVRGARKGRKETTKKNPGAAAEDADDAHTQPVKKRGAVKKPYKDVELPSQTMAKWKQLPPVTFSMVKDIIDTNVHSLLMGSQRSPQALDIQNHLNSFRQQLFDRLQQVKTPPVAPDKYKKLQKEGQELEESLQGITNQLKRTRSAIEKQKELLEIRQEEEAKLKEELSWLEQQQL